MREMRKSNAQDILVSEVPEYGDIITEISEYPRKKACVHMNWKNREELVKTAKAAYQKGKVHGGEAVTRRRNMPGKKPVMQEHQTAL